MLRFDQILSIHFLKNFYFHNSQIYEWLTQNVDHFKMKNQNKGSIGWKVGMLIWIDGWMDRWMGGWMDG